MVVQTPELGTLGKEDTKCNVLLGYIVSCWVTQKDSGSASKEARRREVEEREEKERKWEEKWGQEKPQTSHKLSEQCHQPGTNVLTPDEPVEGLFTIVHGSPVMMEYCNFPFNRLKIYCYYFMRFRVLSVLCSCNSSCRKSNTFSVPSPSGNQARTFVRGCGIFRR